MPDYKLISFALCPYVQRALIVLKEKNVPFERVDIDLANKPDWFLKLSPLGKVPVLQSGDNVLFESQVIAEYLDEVTDGSLHPSDPIEKAVHRAWIEFASQTLTAIWGFYVAGNEEEFLKARDAVAEKFKRVEEQVKGPFFGGDEFHLVDGVWGTVFRYIDVFETIYDFDFYSGSQKLRTWRDGVMARQSVMEAAPADYAERLKAFVKKRDSHLSQYVSEDIAA